MNQFIIGGILLAALGASGLYIKAQHAENATLTIERDAALLTIDAMQKGLTALDKLNQQNQQAQTKLRQQVSHVNTSMADRDQHIQRLEAENENLKLWSNTALPDDVVRLQQHPAITGADDYQAWLSGRHTLQPASEQRPDERGTPQSP